MNLPVPAVEITYGLERILMSLQGAQHFRDIRYSASLTYGTPLPGCRGCMFGCSAAETRHCTAASAGSETLTSGVALVAWCSGGASAVPTRMQRATRPSCRRLQTDVQDSARGLSRAQPLQSPAA